MFFNFIEKFIKYYFRNLVFVWPLYAVALSLFFLDKEVWESLLNDFWAWTSLIFFGKWLLAILIINAAAHFYPPTAEALNEGGKSKVHVAGPVWILARIALALAGVAFLVDQTWIFGLPPVHLRWTGGLLIVGVLILVTFVTRRPAEISGGPKSASPGPAGKRSKGR